MAFGKILGFAALGIVAVAAAPFTGGGSLAGAATLAGSLAGAEAVAVGAAVVGGAIGAASARKDEEEEARNKESHKEKDEKISELSKKADKYEKKFKEALEKFKGDKEYFNYIIATSAMGISMAYSNGEMHQNEKTEIEEFIGGIASSNYPQHVKDEIDKLYKNPPEFATALGYLKKVNPSNYDAIKFMLELVMEADGIHHNEQLAFLEAFNRSIHGVKYIAVKNDTESICLSEIKEKIAA